jgi:hypothetical protein
MEHSPYDFSHLNITWIQSSEPIAAPRETTVIMDRNIQTAVQSNTEQTTPIVASTGSASITPSFNVTLDSAAEASAAGTWHVFGPASVVSSGIDLNTGVRPAPEELSPAITANKPKRWFL